MKTLRRILLVAVAVLAVVDAVEWSSFQASPQWTFGTVHAAKSFVFDWSLDGRATP